jgi:phage tail-like protein
LQLYEEGSFTRLLTVDILGRRVVDIASDTQSAVVLTEDNGEYRVTRVDHRGRFGDSIELAGITDAVSFVYLRRAMRFVVLAGCDPRLYWIAEEGGKAFTSVSVPGLRPCFTPHALGSDGRDRVFLAGADGKEFGGREFVLTLDEEGTVLGDVPIEAADAPVTGIAATRSVLFVTGRRGLTRFDVAESVPEGAREARFMVLTPLLDSPDREDKRRWLRVEATATLPQGSSLEISWAGMKDRPDVERSTGTNDATTASELIAGVLNAPGATHGRTIFHGTAAGSGSRVFSAALFDVKERYLRVSVVLTAAAGSSLPVLSELNVMYPGRTLMEHLPQIYQREEERPNSFLRALVGVLEATTQGMDAGVGSMGTRIHPDTADAPWLDFVARWLGVPWDDGLTLEQKQRIVRRGADLARARGTREGLEALLESLIPGEPRRFRVTDTTADFGFAVVGGRSLTGSPLPAMLGGYTRWRAELDSRAVLGYMRLPCGQGDDGVSHLTGRIRVDVAATAEERASWEPWLLALIQQMIPLTARVELRWVTSQALSTKRLDGTMTIESDIEPHLGTDAITDLSRLPERGARLSDTGANVGTRLS